MKEIGKSISKKSDKKIKKQNQCQNAACKQKTTREKSNLVQTKN